MRELSCIFGIWWYIRTYRCYTSCRTDSHITEIPFVVLTAAWATPCLKWNALMLLYWVSQLCQLCSSAMYSDVIGSLTVAATETACTRQILDIWQASSLKLLYYGYPLIALYSGKWGSWCLWMPCYACRYVGMRAEWQNGMDEEECEAIWTAISNVWAIKPLDSKRDCACRQTAQSLNILLFADHGTQL